MSDFDKPFQWYQELFVRELGLRIVSAETGVVFGTAEQLEIIAQHYLDHPEYSRVGREMLLVALLDSMTSRLEAEQLADSTTDLLRCAMIRAMNDVYDRDQLECHWQAATGSSASDPVGAWIRTEFPDWTPPPSVWSQEFDE